MSHIGIHGNGITSKLIKKSRSIAGSCIANIASFGVGNAKNWSLRVFTYIGKCLLQASPAISAQTFVKGQIGLIGNRIRYGSIDKELVKGKDRIGLLLQNVSRNLLNIGIQSDTKIGTLFSDQAD